MEMAFCTVTNGPISATQFEALSIEAKRQFKMNLLCPGCGDVAWFRSATKPNAKINRAAHFNSHHHSGECDFRTTYSLIDDETNGDITTNQAIPRVTSYTVNLDNKVGGAINDLSEVPMPPGPLVIRPSGGATGKGGGAAYDTNMDRTLRQILSYLKRFPEFRHSDKYIDMYSEAGHLKVSGQIGRLAINFDDVTPDMDDNQYRLFWGLIVDAEDEFAGNGVWLNASASKKGVSVKVYGDIKDSFLNAFKVSELEDLKGAYVLVAGRVHYTGANLKPIIYCALVNFITVQKYREKVN